MRQYRALLGKELAHHGLPALALWLVLAAGFGLLVVGGAASEDQTSRLQVLPNFLLLYMPLAAWFCAHRLVVMEYHGRTQLFLETLPVSRLTMIASKYLLGLFLLLSSAAVVVQVCVSLSLGQEPVERDFNTYLQLRALAYTSALWSFCFLMGLTGRFRTALYMAFAVGVMVLSMQSEFRPLETAPLLLVDPAVMPFARHEMPWTAFWYTLMGSALTTCAGLAIALMKEGSFAEKLSGRMSQREKAVGAFLVVVFVSALITYDVKKKKEPYEFLESTVVSSSKVPLEILYLSEEARPAAETLLSHLEERFHKLQHELQLDQLPPIRVALSEDLDGLTVEQSSLEDQDGVLQRANFTAPDFDRVNLTYNLVHGVLMHHTHYRAVHDPKHWFLDGFSLWWALDEAEQTQALRRALWVTRDRGLDAPRLRAWTQMMDQQGDYQAAAIAYSGLLVLAEQQGREAVMKLASMLLARRPYQDARESLVEPFRSLPRLFLKATGSQWEEFIAVWNRRLTDWRGEPRLLLPPVTASVQVRGQALHYRFDFEQPVGEPTTCTLVHAGAGTFDSWIDPTAMKREEHLLAPGKRSFEGKLEGRYSGGERVFVGLEVARPQWGHPLRIYAARVTIP